MKKKFIRLLGLSLCLVSCSKPWLTITRGTMVLEKYYEGGGIGGHARWPWKILVNGRKFRMPNTGESEFFDCFTGPSKDIPVVFFRTEKHYQFYFLRFESGKPILTPTKFNLFSNGHYWIDDGSQVVIEDKPSNSKVLIDIRSGESKSLPKYPGTFLCFSPDRATIVSLDSQKTKDGFYKLIHQTDSATGASLYERYTLAQYKWLGEETKFKQHESTPNIWIASHFTWVQDASGKYKLQLPEKNH